MVLAEDKIVLTDRKIIAEDRCVKLLFYKDEAEIIHMLIGILSADESSNDESSSDSSSLRNYEASYYKSAIQKQDSIYFIQVQIENTFLEFLDDPVFIEAQDVIENLAFLKSNDKFINQLLKKEIQNFMRLPQSDKPEIKYLSDKSFSKRL